MTKTQYEISFKAEKYFQVSEIIFKISVFIELKQVLWSNSRDHLNKNKQSLGYMFEYATKLQ